jgi:hypothetical protein
MTKTIKLPIEIVKLSDEIQGDGYPFEALILSGSPIETWWGRFVIELSTMTYHKPRLVVNYNHNDQLIIGYGENFQVTPDGLKSTGKLVTGTYADELVKLSKEGVPFEASVEIELDAGVETRVGAESQIMANGRTYSGPISIYNNVPLSGYAICPHGADKFTNFTLLKKEKDFMKKKPLTKLSDDTKDETAPDPEKEVDAAVKSQELADLCAIFGNDNGIKLFQEGADVAEVRQWQSLNEKYSKYLAGTASGDEDKPDDDPKEGAPEKTDDEPKDEPDKDKEDDEKLSAVLTKLNAMSAKLESQTTEIVKLKASIPPNGVEPVSHGNETHNVAAPKNAVQAYAAKYHK